MGTTGKQSGADDPKNQPVQGDLPKTDDSSISAQPLTEAQIEALLNDPKFDQAVRKRSQSEADKLLAPVRSKQKVTDKELKRVAELVGGGMSQADAIRQVKIDRLIEEPEEPEPPQRQDQPIDTGVLIGEAARQAAKVMFPPDVDEEVKNRIIEEVGKASGFVSNLEIMRFVTSHLSAPRPVPGDASKPQTPGKTRVEEDRTGQDGLRKEFLDRAKGLYGEAMIRLKDEYREKGLQNVDL